MPAISDSQSSGRGLGEVALERARGVVDQHIDPPEGRFGLVERGLERGLIGDVGAERQRFRTGLAERRRGLLGGGAVAVEDRDCRPLAPPGAGRSPGRCPVRRP